MQYSFINCLKRIIQSKKIYSLIVIELAIGTTVFFSFLTANIDINERYNRILKEGGDMDYEIKTYASNNELSSFIQNFDYLSWQNEELIPYEYKVNENCPITLNDINYIKENFKDKFDIFFSITRYVIYIDNSSSSLKKCFIVFCYNTKGVQRKNIVPIDTAYTGKNFMKLFTKESQYKVTSKRDFIFESMGENTNKIKTMTNKQLNLKGINSLDDNIYSHIKDILVGYNNKFFSAEDLLVCPIDLYYDFYHPKDSFSYSLFLKPYKDQNIYESITEVLYYLNNIHNGQFSYKIDNKANAYLQKMESASNGTVVMSFISILLICIVILGMIGLLLLTFDKRKKEFAILISCGATKMILLFEICAESIMITSLGGFLGLGNNFFICKIGLIKYGEYILNFNYKMAVIAFCLSVFSGVISVLPLIRKIYVFMPIEILRSL